MRRKLRTDSPGPAGLKRIFEGRLARRRIVLENRDAPNLMTGKLIDHEEGV